jgi:hypothetical protein
MYLNNEDLTRIIQDAKNRNRKEVYLPSSVYKESNLNTVERLYGQHYKVERVTGTKNGLVINL